MSSNKDSICAIKTTLFSIANEIRMCNERIDKLSEEFQTLKKKIDNLERKKYKKRRKTG